MYCEIKILNDYLETVMGMDTDNNSEIENNCDKWPNIAIASMKLLTWMHNNSKLLF